MKPKTYGAMTPAEQSQVRRRAAAKINAELNHPAMVAAIADEGTIDPAARQTIYDKAGASTADVVTAALTLWEAGNRTAALQRMWDDGADPEWLAFFAGTLGETNIDALLDSVDMGGW